ncbi:YgfZ/GcvT domain-containing protein [Synechocystis salina]|uniref:Folate-binding protein YgfZ n=1 Tax=Synechocystis salina LEGE 00031 TaxID=1828736 RepID=A0ABR9VUV0_9SYNC|nr:folate-binding protein YgfZ [Synechocystis salina]MBE9242008.1 folate-binding protein YgfZ [Synechocystis salina LEGE 00041]MBE9255133.1 folate-binding protein YgfZ [Synechocystis salina LEGE 00031]
MAHPLDLEQTWLYPLPEFSLIALQGEDRRRFLHNQTTNAVETRTVGEWFETVFVNSTGRTLELATVYVRQDSLWIQVEANRKDFLWQWMDRFIFPFDKVELEDLSAHYRAVVLLGEKVEQDHLGWQLPAGNQWLAQSVQGVELLVSAQTGLDLPGYTVIFPATQQAVIDQLWGDLAVITPDQWEGLRIHQGRPQANKELTEDYNPLETGLWRAISFTKGCYIGQETIARLNTYQGVKQRLWRIALDRPMEAGTVITLEGQKVGVLTSVKGLTGLGYLKTKLADQGATVQVGEAIGTVEKPPYITHEYYQGPN